MAFLGDSLMHYLWALLVMAGLTFYRFRDVLARMGTAFPGAGNDSSNLFWSIAWGIKHITGGFSGYWSPPFYHPYDFALGFSDTALLSSLIALPSYFLTGSLVVGYNVCFLLTFILTGWGMYGLVHELTQDRWASMVCGVAFMFCHFRIGHLDHLHVLTMQGLPFFLMFFHRHWRLHKKMDLALAGLVLGLQMLGSPVIATFGLYLFLAISLAAILTDPVMRLRSNILRFAGIQVSLGLVFVWNCWPHVVVGMFRKLTASWAWGDVYAGSANVFHYAVVSRLSIFASEWMERYWGNVHELVLFPGLVAVVFGGAWLMMNRKSLGSIATEKKFYVAMAAVGCLLTFGPFYWVLWKFVPPFHGLRVPIRLGLFFQMGIVVVAGFGMAQLLLRIKNKTFRHGLGALLVAFAYFETSLTSVPMVSIPGTSPLYQSAMSRTQGKGMIELPFPKDADSYQTQSPYVFNAVTHWRPMVNGYSSFNPIYYRWLWASLENSPIPPLDYLAVLKVDQVFCHLPQLSQSDTDAIERLLQAHPEKMTVRARTEELLVIDLHLDEVAASTISTMDMPKGSVITASTNVKRLPRLHDGKTGSKWSLRRSQQKGDWLEINFPAPLEMSGCRMELGAWVMDYPRGLAVSIKKNGEWVRQSDLAWPYPPAASFKTMVDTPRNPSLDVYFGRQSAEGIRLELLADHDKNHWSIAELKLIP